MFDAGGQHLRHGKYAALRVPQALSSVPHSATNTIRYSSKIQERYATDLSLAPISFLNSLCCTIGMAESLDLFESVINSQWFLCTSIMFFFNEMDFFKSHYQSFIIDNDLLFCKFRAVVVVIFSPLRSTKEQDKKE